MDDAEDAHAASSVIVPKRAIDFFMNGYAELTSLESAPTMQIQRDLIKPMFVHSPIVEKTFSQLVANCFQSASAV